MVELSALGILFKHVPRHVLRHMLEHVPTQSSATSNTSPPTLAVPSEISNCLKPQKKAAIKAKKLFSFFFGVILKLCESYKVVVLLV